MHIIAIYSNFRSYKGKMSYGSYYYLSMPSEIRNSKNFLCNKKELYLKQQHTVLFCLLAVLLNYPIFHQIIAKKDAPTTVKIPATTMDKLLKAPSIFPISIALAVPTAWEETPMAIPFATGSLI